MSSSDPSTATSEDVARAEHPVIPSPVAPLPSFSSDPAAPVAARLKRAILGAPRDLQDRGLFHQVSLVAVLAWVGLGADGLSSSAYGPEEAFRALGEHTYLAVLLAIITGATVLIISACYSRIIEQFPHGGGGYVVATRLLGRRCGLVSGCALLIDYVLTITVSIAAAGDAIFSLPMVPRHWVEWKLPLEASLIIGLLTLNIRGVRESIMALAPVFFIFVITHTLLIIGGIAWHVPEMPTAARSVAGGFEHGLSTLGPVGLLLLLVHAFSLGGGTYTGIEAVSNGVPMMRPPQAQTAKRTMVYMAVSLAFTAAGLLMCYLLWHVSPEEGRTMNAVLVDRIAGGLPMGKAFIFVFLAAEGAILVVAAQAGFADGPRVLSNMALDSWMPRRFAALSDRLTTQNGIVLMGVAALAALLHTRGDVRQIVVMYSINVFLTFSLSLIGMTLHILRSGVEDAGSTSRLIGRATLFITGSALCVTILVITAIEKFSEGGWITLLLTGTLVVVCLLIRSHYATVQTKLERAFEGLERIPDRPDAVLKAPDPNHPTAVVLVGGYGGFGIHTTLNVFRAFPNHFKGVVFVSVGVVDSGGFRGEDSIDHMRTRTQEMLDRYLDLARRLGIAAAARCAVGTDVINEAETVCLEVAKEFPRSLFFAGQVIFERETWFRRILHNQTAYAIQRRLQWAGRTMIILAARVQ